MNPTESSRTAPWPNGSEASQAAAFDRPGSTAGASRWTEILRESLGQPRGLLAWLALLVTVFSLWAARAFVVPVTVSVVLAVLLWPAVRAAESVLRWRVVAAFGVTLASTLFLVALALPVGSRVADLSRQLPQAVRAAAKDIADIDTRRAVDFHRTRVALVELDRSVARATGTEQASASPKESQGVSIVSGLMTRLREGLIDGARSIAAAVLQGGAIVLLVFFLLCSGPELAGQIARRLDAAWPRLEAGALMARLGREIRGFGRLTLLVNAGVGVAVAALFALIGVEQPLGWGLTAFVLHFVPYAGLALLMVMAFIAIYAAQASLGAALLGAACVAGVGLVVGTVLATWLQGRSTRLDSALLFAGTLFWSLVWGPWGLLLAPLLLVTAHACLTQASRPEPVADPAIVLVEAS